MNIRLRFYFVKSFFLVFICLFSNSLFPVETAFTYLELIEQAARNIRELRFEKAKEKLSIAKSIQAPEHKFYFLLGEAELGLGYREEALVNFKKSLEFEKNQPEIYLKCADISADLKKTKDTYFFTEGYLSLKPDDRKILYRMLVLSSRLGMASKRKSTLLKLKKENPYLNDLEAILTQINEEIADKKFDLVFKDIDKFLPYFPDNESLHKALVIATKIRRPENLETVLIDSAAVFKHNPKYSVEYGLYLLEKNKLFESLSTLRRAFLVSILMNGFEADEEILYFIRQVYYQLGRNQDAVACLDLAERVKKRQNQDFEDLYSLINLHNNNRECIIFTLLYLSENGMKKEYEEISELLYQRDRQMQDKEYMDVLGAFSFENLTMETERPFE